MYTRSHLQLRRAPRRGATRAGVAALALLVVACGGTRLEPRLQGTIRGAYALTSAAGSPLPHLLAASTSYVDREIADTLILDGRGGGTNVDIVQREFTDGTAAQRRRTTAAVYYVVSRDTLYFRVTCPPQTACQIVAPEGWFLADGTLVIGIVDATRAVVSQTVRSYRRIDWPTFARGGP